MFKFFLIFILISLGLTGCGGSSGGSSSPTSETTKICEDATVDSLSTICGTVKAAANMLFDSDLNDANTRYLDNSNFAKAQQIQNFVTLQGFVNKSPTINFSNNSNNRSFDRFYTTADTDDVFKVQLQAGQLIQLQVINYEESLNNNETFYGDINLELYDSGYNLVAASFQASEFKSVEAPVNDVYFINVTASNGASRYVLQILPPDSLINDSSSQKESIGMDFEPNQLIIQYKNTNSVHAQNHSLKTLHTGVTRPTLAYLEDTVNFSINSNSDSLLSELAHLNPKSFQKKNTLTRLKQLKQQDHVLDASLNYIRHIQKVPSDTYYNYQWHYPAMKLPQAWDITTGTPESGSIVVAIIDTGIFSAHPDLRNQLVNGYDFISNAQRSGDDEPGIDSNPEDTGDGQDLGSSSWHGTHVAGTVAAETNNNSGVAGVSWGAKIMPLRALGKNGGTTYDILQAVRFAAGLDNDSNTLPEKRADIINLSLGSSSSSSVEASLFKQVHDLGIMIVASAGNENTNTPSYPASYDGVISVSATDYSNTKAPYSNYGSFIDIAAPGGNNFVNQNGDIYPDGVLSTLVDASTGIKKAIFSFYEGTSMAAPHVSGMLALMKAVYPNLNAETLDNLLAAGLLTDDAGTAGHDDIYGFGNANALKAVQAALALENGDTPPDSPPVLLATPSSLNFSTNTSTEIVISNEGDGTPAITNISASNTWITISESNVDANGLGTYLISVDANSLSDGLYLGSISFSFDSAPSLTIRISLNVGSIDSSGKLATIYILLYDIEKDEVIDSVEGITNANNAAVFTFNHVPDSTYYLITGTDIDNDGYICQLGEACAIYPSSSQIAPIDNTNLEAINVDMTASILNSLNSINESNVLITNKQERGIPRKVVKLKPASNHKSVAK